MEQAGSNDPRIAVVTGSSRGIGLATSELLGSEGCRVVGVDMVEADVIADLSTPAGRDDMVAGIRSLCPEGIDVIVANAGVLTSDVRCLRVNYFGAVATLDRLRPLMRESAPRAVVVASRSVLKPVDEDLVEACLSGDEDYAVSLAEQKLPEVADLLYATSKRAIGRWMRRSAPSAQWAGTGIALNGVGPGAVSTDMIAGRDPEEQERLARERPMPLGGMATPREVAEAIAFLVDRRNTKISGQLVFVDGAGETLMCHEDIWKGMLK